MSLRIGHGFDVHAFTEQSASCEITLAGVKIPFDKNLIAHSDGDVVLHAVCDALLGAAALGDIGRHFSDQDDEFKDMSSRILLERVMRLLKKEHLLPSNVDVTVIAQVPKLSSYIEKMRFQLAADLHLDLDKVNIKATTTEHLGYIGREEGIAVHAVCLLHS